MNGASPHHLPKHLQDFIAVCTWTFAKSYADTWPHEYIVRKNVDEELFVQLVQHIRAHGYEDLFYEKPITYFDHDGMVYLTMGSPIEKTIIINRCQKGQTYRERYKNGTLPKEPISVIDKLNNFFMRATPEEMDRFEKAMQGVLSGKMPDGSQVPDDAE